MIYRGYDIKVPFPPGSGEVRVEQAGKLVKTFPYSTKDEEVMDWIDAERKRDFQETQRRILGGGDG
jgi:Zn-dependent M32 family carboxypeptidase